MLGDKNLPKMDHLETPDGSRISLTDGIINNKECSI
jgi:hypothetical protein